jgi:diaminopimelate epimerase
MDFLKYHATGNDFIMLDNRQGQFEKLYSPMITLLCDRRKGIGADGLIMLNSHEQSSFYMDYVNADGTRSFCGNGARCAVGFALSLGIINSKEFIFSAIDGEHKANVLPNDAVLINMSVFGSLEHIGNDFTLHTGSPHFVRFVESVAGIDVEKEGRDIRNANLYRKDGINVNFVEVISDDEIRIRTYERGVEAETLSCGTGATACALVYAMKNRLKGWQKIRVRVEGGELEVRFRLEDGNFHEIALIGPFRSVYNGRIETNDLL